MSQESLLVATASRGRLVFIAVLGSTLVAVGIWCLASGELDRPIEFAGAWLMILGLPFAVYETAMQRFEFGQGIVRFRTLLRWREEMIPLKLRLELSTQKVITVWDADTGSLIVEVTNVFTRGGELLGALAEFYQANGRDVHVHDDSGA